MKVSHLVVVALLAFASGTVLARTIHREHSLYRNIIVTQTGNLRCLVFTLRRDNHNQSCLDLRNKKRLVFAYVRMTMGALLLNPNPKHVLVVGLGGGSIPMTLTALYPDASIDIVELDPAVTRVAKTYFEFAETPKMKVITSDGRVFVKRAGLAGKHYDLVVLDAFNGDYIPEHLMTREFLSEVKTILTPGGVLAANTFATSALYDYESQTYKSVYGHFLNFRLPETGNRIIIATNGPLPNNELLTARARDLAPMLAPYGVKLTSFIPHMQRKEDWNHSKPVLTDEYSPANLLRGRRRD